ADPDSLVVAAENRLKPDARFLFELYIADQHRVGRNPEAARGGKLGPDTVEFINGHFVLEISRRLMPHRGGRSEDGGSAAETSRSQEAHNYHAARQAPEARDHGRRHDRHEAPALDAGAADRIAQ